MPKPLISMPLDMLSFVKNMVKKKAIMKNINTLYI